MGWYYGLMEEKNAKATVASYDPKERCAFVVVPKFRGRILLREKEILFPCGPFNIATDDVGKDIHVGDVYTCRVLETFHGLICLAARKERYSVDEVPEATQIWDEWPRMELPRFMGIVDGWKQDKRFGFINCDDVPSQIYFNYREIMVPYHMTGDPYEAVTINPIKGMMVVFDIVEAHKGMRALAVKTWKKDFAS